MDYDVINQVMLSAGVRYDDDQRIQINLNTGTERRASFNAVEPKFTVIYKFTPTVLGYVTYGVGFRSGGFNQPNFSIPIFAEEKLKNYEVGVKSQWFDRKLTVNAAAFTGNVTGYQYSYIDFATASPVTGNLDKVRINGGELEARFIALTGLSLFANVGIAIPKIKESSQFPQYVGNETPRASNYSLQGGFDYSWPVSERLSLFVASNVQYESKRYWYIDNLDVQNPKTYLNGSAGIRSGALTLTLWGKNLLDTKAYDTYDPNQATGLGRDVGLPIKPLAFGVELSVRY